jgi:hypothetical protein
LHHLDVEDQNAIHEGSPIFSVESWFSLLDVPLAVERIEGDPEAHQRQVVFLSVGYLFHMGHPATLPMEPDARDMLPTRHQQPFFVRLPSVAQLADGRDGGGFAVHVSLKE